MKKKKIYSFGLILLIMIINIPNTFGEETEQTPSKIQTFITSQEKVIIKEYGDAYEFNTKFDLQESLIQLTPIIAYNFDKPSEKVKGLRVYSRDTSLSKIENEIREKTNDTSPQKYKEDTNFLDMHEIKNIISILNKSKSLFAIMGSKSNKDVETGYKAKDKIRIVLFTSQEGENIIHFHNGSISSYIVEQDIYLLKDNLQKSLKFLESSK